MNIRDYYKALDPDDVIRNDGLEYVSEGRYAFVITEVEGGFFHGSQKIPPCPQMTVSVLADTPAGLVPSKFFLYLCRSFEWKLSAFFRCIGLKKPGEPLKMDWDHLPGCIGTAYFQPETFFDDNMQKRTALNLVKFLDPYKDADAGDPEDTS